ncbi:MAG: putative Ig domain-containing protein, partial [Acidobacteria bacterium]|nr:putative Ig domain-containing protein [Acidobacteriota bacterium]
MNFQRQVAHAGGHMDVTRDINGDEVLVWTNSADANPLPGCNNGFVKIRLADGQQTCLLSVDWSLAVHVSGSDDSGWVFVETYAPSDPDPLSSSWRTYTNEILQIKLDGTEVRRLAHHRSRPFNSYNWTPRVSASRDGSRFVFNSNYGLQGILGYTAEYSDVYLVVLSDTTNTTGSGPSITTSSLSSGTQNAAYSAILTATGGTTPYTWSIISGSLQAGLTLGSSTGIISGTPTGTGTNNFTVQVTDIQSQTATKALSLTVNAAAATNPPSITTSALPSGTQNTAYSATMTATDGTTPYTWSIASGSLPAGLTLGSPTISGTPTGTGTSSFTVRVTDANSQTTTKALSITINSDGSTPPPTSAARFEQDNAAISYSGTWYNNTLSGHSAGSSGLSMDAGSRSTFTFNGTAVRWLGYRDEWSGIARVYLDGQFKATVDTYASPSQFQAVLYSTTGLTSSTHTLVIEGTGTRNSASGGSWIWVDAFDVENTIPPPSITTTSLPSGTQNTTYSATLAATSGATPYTWSIASGSLPAGLTLAASAGVISGTPTGTGTNNFTVKVTDINSQAATKALSLTVNAPPPSITTTALPSGTQNTAYSAMLTATNGTIPYTWSVVLGSLPVGLTLTSSTGVISGTPTGTGTSNFTVQVADAISRTATKALSLTINAGT